MGKNQKTVLMAWAVTSIAAVLAVLTWLQGVNWHISKATSDLYQLFPLLGLLAFSVMWSHYIASVIRQQMKVEKHILSQYFELTSLVVLIAILLHPSLLWLQLWRDGLGLPPNSYLVSYVDPALRWAAMLGTLCLLIFLAYELRRKFAVKNWWKYISYASDFAMLAIFVHGAKLGRNLQSGWFTYVWYFYGFTLIASLIYIHYQKYQRKAEAS